MIKNNATKHTINDLIHLMEDAGESKDHIIGWMSSMIGYFARPDGPKVYTLQDEIESGIRFYQDKAIKAGRQAVLA